MAKTTAATADPGVGAKKDARSLLNARQEQAAAWVQTQVNEGRQIQQARAQQAAQNQSTEQNAGTKPRQPRLS